MIKTNYSIRADNGKLSLYNDKTPILTGLDLNSLIATPYYGNVNVAGTNIDLQYDPILDTVNVLPNTGWIGDFIDGAKNSTFRVSDLGYEFHNRANGSFSGDIAINPVANFNINAGWIDSANNDWLKLGYVKANRFRIVPSNFASSFKQYDMRLDRGVGWPNKRDQIVELSNTNIHIEYNGGTFTRTASLPNKHEDGYWNQGYLFYLKGDNNRVVIDFFEGIDQEFPMRDTNGTECFSMFNFEGSNNLVIVNVLKPLKFRSGWISKDTYHTMFSTVRTVKYTTTRNDGNSDNERYVTETHHRYESEFSNNVFILNIQPNCGIELPNGGNGQIHLFSGHCGRYSLNVLKFGNTTFNPGHWFR